MNNETQFDFGGEIAWRPSPELIAQSNLTRFMRAHDLPSLEQLQQRSTIDLDWFWNAVLKDLDIRFRQPYSRVLDLSRGIAWPDWCEGNAADHPLSIFGPGAGRRFSPGKSRAG